MARLGLIRKLQSMAGSSVTHRPANFLSQFWMTVVLKIRGFRPCRIMPFARSTWPLVLGWATAAQSTLMWYSSQNSRNLFPVNCVPLSVMIELGTPKQWMMSRKKPTASSDLILATGRASIYFVNLSTETSRCV